MNVPVEIDTDSLAFRLAVAMRRCAVAFQGLSGALDASRWRELNVRAAERRAFDRAVDEAARR